MYWGNMSSVKSLAVFDVETTGLNPSVDRLVEIGIVLLDPATLEVIDEFDSLINPQRDLTGSTKFHGISASMVSAAPTFGDISSRVSDLLSGSIVVAHNLPFDVSFLKSEFSRLGVSPDFGQGIDTLKLTRMNLGSSCIALGIELDDAHRALSDARACADLLVALTRSSNVLSGHPADFGQIPQEGSFRTLRREQVNEGHSRQLRIPPIRFCLPAQDDADLTYLLILDKYLSDGALTAEEIENLHRLAEVLDISAAVPELHARYFENALRAAAEDGDISEVEKSYLDWLSSSLGIEMSNVHLPSREVLSLRDFDSGLRVCFTGTTADQERDLYALLMTRGHVPVESVTKKGCDVLVCVDTSTMSGKAKKARDYGIITISVNQFVADLG